MLPTDPDREENASAPKDNNDNPFIKFKRFADAQIGAVLQGIIGLPSVFTKQPNDVNSLWADLHGDLKRGDTVLLELRTSKSAESLSGKADTQDEQVSMPVKKYSWWSLPPSAQADSLSRSDSGKNNGEQGSTELFSPVTKSLFAHLTRRPKDDVDWDKHELLAQTISSKGTNLELQRDLRDDQMSGSALNMLQFMVFNSLNRTASFVGNSQLISSQSVLPYVLFSPYSPLALSLSSPTARGNSFFQHPEDDFPYCAAFEDLLLASQGRPMATWTSAPAHLRNFKNAMAFGDSQDRELRSASTGLEWIERLWNRGILTKEPPSSSFFSDEVCEAPLRRIDLNPGQCLKKIDDVTSERQEDHETEQNVSDYLERIGGGTSPSPLPLRDAMRVMEAFLKDAVNSLAAQENKTGSIEGSSCAPTSPWAARSNPGQDEVGTANRLEVSSAKSASTQTAVFHDEAGEASVARSRESDWMGRLKDGSAAPPDTDRVIDVTTTTRQYMDNFGIGSTTVSIQKSYADGRVSVITTSKLDSPPTEPFFSRVRSTGLPGDERCPECDAKYHDVDESKRQKAGKSHGWFWN